MKIYTPKPIVKSKDIKIFKAHCKNLSVHYLKKDITGSITYGAPQGLPGQGDGNSQVRILAVFPEKYTDKINKALMRIIKSIEEIENQPR